MPMERPARLMSCALAVSTLEMGVGMGTGGGGCPARMQKSCTVRVGAVWVSRLRALLVIGGSFRSWM